MAIFCPRTKCIFIQAKLYNYSFFGLILNQTWNALFFLFFIAMQVTTTMEAAAAGGGAPRTLGKTAPVLYFLSVCS